MNFLFIALGGGSGALLRYLSTQGVGALAKASFPTLAFPAGTLAVNAAGSLLAGVLFGLFENRAVPPGLRLFLVTGFLGGFTTFSAYSLETVRLCMEGHSLTALANAVLSNALCLTLTLLGIGLSRLMRA